jgi:antitoxin HicB
MKTEATKNLDRYMGLPYTVVLRPDEEGDVVAKVRELTGCVAHGRNEREALDNLREIQRVWLEDCIESGQPVPEPEIEEHLPSGKWVQRVPRTLHKRLSKLAEHEHVSLNQLVTAMLSEAVLSRTWSKDATEPEKCASCPLNRADIWDYAFSATEDWDVALERRPSLDTLDKIRRSFSKQRFANADETEELANCSRR